MSGLQLLLSFLQAEEIGLSRGSHQPASARILDRVQALQAWGFFFFLRGIVMDSDSHDPYLKDRVKQANKKTRGFQKFQLLRQSYYTWLNLLHSRTNTCGI